MSEFPDFKQMLADSVKKFDVSVGLGTTPPKTNKRPTQPILERSRGVVESFYNIHKRSLPVGINKVVGWGFTMEQAKNHIARYHKVKFLPLERDQEIRTVIYHDIVNQEDKDCNIYKNDAPIIQENTEENPL